MIVDEERLLNLVAYGVEVKTMIVGMVVPILAGIGIEREEISCAKAEQIWLELDQRTYRKASKFDKGTVIGACRLSKPRNEAVAINSQ